MFHRHNVAIYTIVTLWHAIIATVHGFGTIFVNVTLVKYILLDFQVCASVHVYTCVPMLVISMRSVLYCFELVWPL